MKILSVLALIAFALNPAAASAQSDSSAKSNAPRKISKAAPHEPNSAAGFWEQSDDQGKVGAWFYFTEVDGLYQGRIVKTFPPPGAKPALCTACTGNQKNAALLGLVIVKGMHRDGLNYTDGTILDPRDGSVYKAQMQVSADGQKLSVRGYLGLPMLGQTQVWNRLPDDSMASEDIPPVSVSPSTDN